MNPIAPSEHGAREVRVVLPKITLAMLICGIVGAGAVGAASAASAASVDEDVPAVAVKYDPAVLATDRGARQVYARIVNAAALVCPQYASNPRWVTRQVQECREQSIARAVMKINNPKLVAIYHSNVKNG